MEYPGEDTRASEETGLGAVQLCVFPPSPLLCWDKQGGRSWRVGRMSTGNHAGRDSLEKISQPKRPTQGIPEENEVLWLAQQLMISIQREEELIFLGLIVKWAQSKTEGQLSSKLDLQLFTFKWGLAPSSQTEIKTFYPFHVDWPSYHLPQQKAHESYWSL